MLIYLGYEITDGRQLPAIRIRNAGNVNPYNSIGGA
jgi:hypothetical protein